MIRQTRLNQERIDVATRRQVLGAGLAGAAGLAGVGLITTFGAEPAFATGSSVTILNTTATLTTSGFYGCDSGGGAFTVTLPSAVGFTSGLMTISKYTDDTNIITIATVSSQTIGTNVAGGPNAVQVGLLNQGDAFDLYSDGTNWQFARQPKVLGITTINPNSVYTTTSLYETPVGGISTYQSVSVNGVVPPSGQIRSRLNASCFSSGTKVQQDWILYAATTSIGWMDRPNPNETMPVNDIALVDNVYEVRPVYEIVFSQLGYAMPTFITPGDAINVVWMYRDLTQDSTSITIDDQELTLVIEVA